MDDDIVDGLDNMVFREILDEITDKASIGQRRHAHFRPHSPKLKGALWCEEGGLLFVGGAERYRTVVLFSPEYAEEGAFG